MSKLHEVQRTFILIWSSFLVVYSSPGPDGAVHILEMAGWELLTLDTIVPHTAHPSQIGAVLYKLRFWPLIPLFHTQLTPHK